MQRQLCLLLVLAALLGSTMILNAQVTATGSLMGTVTDKTGAVVPNANVKITIGKRA